MVLHVGHIPLDEMPALLRGAEALVFPSLFEGFGMPLVEAMASGCPVAATDRGAIADAIRRIVGDDGLRFRLRAAGLARAAEFRWDDVADRHMAVYRRALTARIAR